MSKRKPVEPCTICGKPITDKEWREAGCGCCWHVKCYRASNTVGAA